MNIDETIEKVRSSRDYRRSAENREWLAEIENDLERLKTDEAFQNIDQIKILRSRIKSIIVSASKRLIDEDDAEKRLKIKADRDAFTWLLRYFSRDIDKEMAEIDGKLQDVLERS